MTRIANLFRGFGAEIDSCIMHTHMSGKKCKNADLLNNITGTAERYQLEKSTNIGKSFLLADDKHGTEAEEKSCKKTLWLD